MLYNLQREFEPCLSHGVCIKVLKLERTKLEFTFPCVRNNHDYEYSD